MFVPSRAEHCLASWPCALCRDDVDHPGRRLDWGEWAITANDPAFAGQGAKDTGQDFLPAPGRQRHCQWRPEGLNGARPRLRAARGPGAGLASLLFWAQGRGECAGWPTALANGASGTELLAEKRIRSHAPLPTVAADLDHTNQAVQGGLLDWLRWLNGTLGLQGWRLDFVKGYDAQHAKQWV